MSVDFRELDERKLFAIMLKYEQIDFGYIPKWRRRAFLKFLKKHKIIRPYCFPNAFPRWSWKAEHDFTYTVTWVDFGGLPGRHIAEWWYDLTAGEKRGREHYNHVVRFHVSRNNDKKPGFDYIILNGDLIYG